MGVIVSVMFCRVDKHAQTIAMYRNGHHLLHYLNSYYRSSRFEPTTCLFLNLEVQFGPSPRLRSLPSLTRCQEDEFDRQSWLLSGRQDWQELRDLKLETRPREWFIYEHL